MTTSDDLILSFVFKRFSYFWGFSLARSGDRYYLIDCSQTFLGQICSLIYWIKPIRLWEISPVDFERLGPVQLDSQVNPIRKKINGVWTVLGIFLGQFIYSYSSNFPNVKHLAWPLFLGVLVTIALLRWLHTKNRRQKLLGELNDGILREKIVLIKPRENFWKAIKDYLGLLVVTCIFIWIYFVSGELMFMILMLLMLLLHGIQSQFAFRPGAYEVVEVKI